MAKKVNLLFIALPYVTAKLHIGRLIGTFLPADIYKRFLSSTYSKKSYLLSGLDCYGTAVYQEAINSNLSFKEYLIKKERAFYKTLQLLNINISRKFRTASNNHRKFVNLIFEILKKENRLISKETKELYCSKCDLVLCQRFLIDSKGRNYESILEEQKLLKLEESNVDETNSFCAFCKKRPENKIFNALFLNYNNNQLEKDEFLKKFNLKETEKQISRAFLKWGVLGNKNLIELNNNENFTFYVWIEALISYMEMYARLNLNANQIETIKYFYAKDNDYYHRVIYPNLIPNSKNYNHTLTTLNTPYCKKLPDLELLRTNDYNVFKRNYIINENKEKLSSSKQNFITLDDFKNVNKDVLRFGLANADCLVNDSIVSIDRILSSCDLYLKKFVNNYNRVIGYIKNKKISLKNNLNLSIHNNTSFFDLKNYYSYMLNNNLKLAIEELFKFQHDISKEIDQKIRKKDSNWQTIYDACILLNKLLQPFTPKASYIIHKALKKQIKIKFNKINYDLSI